MVQKTALMKLFQTRKSDADVLKYKSYSAFNEGFLIDLCFLIIVEQLLFV